MMEQHRRMVTRRRLLDRELHLGEDRSAVSLGYEERTSLAGRLCREIRAVDDADRSCDGIHPEAFPHEVQERHRRHDHQLDPLV